MSARPAAHMPLGAAVCRSAAITRPQWGARALAAFWAVLGAYRGVRR